MKRGFLTIITKIAKLRKATDNTWVTLWLVTLTNYNVTRVQRNKKILSKRKKKDTCDIVVGQCHQPQCHTSATRKQQPLLMRFSSVGILSCINLQATIDFEGGMSLCQIVLAQWRIGR